jgi:hypothetical protein
MMKDGVLDCKVDLQGSGLDDVVSKGVKYLHSGQNIGKVGYTLSCVVLETRTDFCGAGDDSDGQALRIGAMFFGNTSSS